MMLRKQEVRQKNDRKKCQSEISGRRQEEFWLSSLAGELPILNLTTDFRRPPVMSMIVEQYSLASGQEFMMRLGKLAGRVGATPNKTLLSLFYVLLYKYTGQSDMLVGIPAVTRMDVESALAEEVGRLMPVRAFPASGKTFRQFVREVMRTVRACQENQAYSFEILKDKLEVTRDVSRNELFDVAFIPWQHEENSDAGKTRERLSAGAGLDLTLEVEEGPGYTQFHFVYCTALFHPDTIRQLGARFLRLMESAEENPDGLLENMNMMSFQEREQVLVEFNQNQMDMPRDKTVVDLFSAQTAKSPERVAVVHENTSYTYQILYEKSDRLAAFLQKKGVGRNSVVPIMTGRGLAFYLGVWGILKAGGAYLPIDPDYPQNRIDFMLEDSGAQLLLSEAQWRGKAGEFQGEWLDLHQDFLYGMEEKPVYESHPEDLAYIIYTSGSTGKPKGAMIEHRNLLNLCLCENQYNGMTEEDRVGSYSSFGFDASVWSNFPPLLAGAAVHVIPDEIRLSLDQLNEYFEKHKITVAFLPTQFCEQFMQMTENRSLRVLATGGEKMKYFRPQPYQLVNGYGPTEYTVYTTRFVVDKDYDNIPIGRPLANTWAYVLNSLGQLLPAGIPGELCIAGVQMGRGYLNRPELTAEKFIPNPFQTGPENAVLYKTGDLVRWLPNGTIEYLGRIDQQVKIRGFRVEIGEIEQRMLEHPLIKDGVVIAREDKNGGKYLCGYYVGGEELSPEKVKEFLAAELPEYMIPVFLLQMETLPVNTNGKVDKRALPEPTETLTAGEDYIEPQGETEVCLAKIWQQLLGLERVGATDSFFHLGGTSLGISLLAARLQKEFQVRIPVRDLFSLDTIQALAECIHKTGKKTCLEIAKLPDQEVYPVSSVERRLYALDQMPGIGTAYHVLEAFLLDGPLDVQRLGQAMEAMIQRHEAFRTSYETRDGELVRRVHSDIKYKKIIKYVTEEQAEEAILQFADPFDLSNPPLFRSGLLVLDPQKHILVLNVHHIVFDGVSLRVFLDELMAIYHGEELAPVALRYRDYAVWHNELLASSNILEQEKYWTEHLSGELPVINLPTDRPRPASRSYEGSSFSFVVPGEIGENLRQLAVSANTTMFMVLLAAYYVLLSQYSRQEDVIVGVPVSGRSQPDLEGTVGMFVNTLPLRAKPEGEKSFFAFLQEVRNVSLQGIEHQDYPLELMVNKLNLLRNSSRNPLFDVVFTYRDQDGSMQVGPLSISPYPREVTGAQFDLVLEATEGKDGLNCHIEYGVRIFDRETIQRISRHYVNLLQDITVHPDKPLHRLQLFSHEERRRMLVDFSGEKCPIDPADTLPGVFARQVAAFPERLALVYRDRQYTYRQLDEITDRLAGVLRRKGAGPDCIIPVLVNRSAEYIVGILAVLKAGAAYLPIDPAYPDSRIGYMLEDSHAKILLSEPGLKEKSVGFVGEWLDITDEKMYEEMVGPLLPVNKPSDLAYIIYTSGSTGKPKGVMIEHHSLLNLCMWAHEHYQLTEADCGTAYAGLGFDACVHEIFPILTCGGALHMLAEDIRLSPIQLNEYFEKNRITFSFLPTQFCEQFMELAENTSLRYLLTGGDKLRKIYWRGYQLVNEYGPTEYTVVTTVFFVDREYDNIPIGRPLANTRIYILDKYSNLLPVGVPGELCVSGPQLARGYLNRDDLTQEKFVPDPFVPGERMYRTGDLARWLPDGNVEFLGRIDQQVKIRGFRIELGEIEQQILHQPGVQDAIVIDLMDSRGAKYLSAYVTPQNAGEVLDWNEIKKQLAKELPDYMIPSYCTQMEKIPLTANGKVDRKGLPEPETGQGERENYVPPASDAEEKIAAVWREALGMDDIGIHDNFFSLGGNSIKAIGVVAKLQKHFDVTMNQLFEWQTIGELAEHVQPRKDNLKARLEKVRIEIEDQEGEAKRRKRNQLQREEKQRAYREKNEKYQCLNGAASKEYKNVLLTGATGFLGAHVLWELLMRQKSHITVIIRGKTPAEATERLKQKIAYYFGSDFWLEQRGDQRVTVLQGELQQKNLGLSLDEYKGLTEKIDCIINTAANVHHYGLYQEFYDSNVQSVLELLELAKTGCKKDMHHISTVSVADGVIEGQDYCFYTEYDGDVGQRQDNHYIKTKTLAEKAVVEARAAGVDGSIYRVGNIAIHSETGLYQENIEENAFYVKLKAFVNIGWVPNRLDEVEFSFVNGLARAISLLAYCPDLSNETYHLYNPETVKLSRVLTDSCLGLQVRSVEIGEFMDCLYQYMDKPGFRSHVENLLLHFGWMDEAGAVTEVEMTLEKTTMILSKLGFVWGELETKKLEKTVYQALRERIRFLLSTSLFYNLPAEEVAKLAAAIGQEVYNGDVLWENHPNRDLHLIWDGYLEVSRSAKGGWIGTVGVLSSKDFVGEEGLLTEGNSSITAEAVLGDVLTLRIPNEIMIGLMNAYPMIGMNMMQALNARVRKLERLIVNLG